MSIPREQKDTPVAPRKRGGRPRTTDPGKLPPRLPAHVKELVAALNELLNRAELTAEEVSHQRNLTLTSQQFHDRMIRKSGPPPEVYVAILTAAATALDTTFDALHQDLRPLSDLVYSTGAGVLPPAYLQAAIASPAEVAAPVIDPRAQAEWLLGLLDNAREEQAIAELDERFHGNDTALAAVLIEVAELDRFAVGLLLDTIAGTDRPRAVAIRRAINERDEKAGAAIFEVCNLSGPPDDPPDAAGPALLADHDPDLGAGRRIAALLEQRRETARIVREVGMRVEADQAANGRPRRPSRRRRSAVLDRRTWRERPKCSRSFQKLIYAITMSDPDRGPRRLADLLRALHDAEDFVSLSHCVIAFFDLRVRYGKPVFRAAPKVFAHTTTDVILEILSHICTKARLHDEDNGEAAYADLEMLMWALDDIDLALVSQKVASMPRTADLSIGHFVANLPNISSFWRRVIAEQDGYIAAVLLGRAFADWTAGDRGEIQPEDYPPLRWIASALVDVDATHRMPRLSRRTTPVRSPVISMVKRLLHDNPAAAVALLQAIVLDHHPRMDGLLNALVEDPEALKSLTATFQLISTNTAPLHLFERLIANLPDTAELIYHSVATADFPAATEPLLDEMLDIAPTFKEKLTTQSSG